MIRLAVPEDFTSIMSIYAYARSFMQETGNPNQWGNHFPPEALIHKVASDGTIHGFFSQIVDYCWAQIPHLRVDTHADNQIMQHLILKNGFERRGIIYVLNHSPRIAFERVK